MTQQYYSLITNAGLIKNAAANSPGGSPVNLTHLAVGDSNGSYYNPTGTAVALQNEKYRTELTHVVIDEDNPNQLIVEAVINETVGPFYIREVGVFDEDGELFAIGKYPETFKPDLPDGSGKRLYIRMLLGFASSPNVELIISDDINNDPNFSTDVNNALAERLVKTQNLADLSNPAAARNNIEVYSKSETYFVGDYKISAQNSNHGKWLICNGQTASRTGQATLFALIGTSFGVGDGSTTFNLPDMRGRVPGIAGQGSGLTNRIIGNSVGAEQHILTQAQLPNYNLVHTKYQGACTSGIWEDREARGGCDMRSYNININSGGFDQPFNNIQPTGFIGNLFIFAG
jgi:phage-related tail fiber protein